ncbi:MAG: energy-coupling factor transporter transmembrane protein EcfT [Chloroflexi bacterium]|nr:energy-coupling factor transporter transmembrane protein EcfT [Chloroflexota bacterium]
MAPLEARPDAPIARVHPLPKLVAATILAIALFITVDIVTSAVVVAVLALAFPLTGLPLAGFARRAAPLAAAAAGIAFFNSVFGQHGATGGIAAALRITGISLAGLIAVTTIDPTDLADALVQHTRASPRFIVGALAASRLAPLFGQEWEILGLARRARGVGSERWIDRIRDMPGRTFALLVSAIRRATRLALAMDARGFGQRACRTVARPRPISPADLALPGAALLLASAATALSVALGTWRPLVTF